jgi:hypothetical protein
VPTAAAEATGLLAGNCEVSVGEGGSSLDPSGAPLDGVSSGAPLGGVSGWVDLPLLLPFFSFPPSCGRSPEPSLWPSL